MRKLIPSAAPLEHLYHEVFDDGVDSCTDECIFPHRTSHSQDCEMHRRARVSDRLELVLGSDLQYIRINGTIVGALVGCAIYLLSIG